MTTKSGESTIYDHKFFAAAAATTTKKDEEEIRCERGTGFFRGRDFETCLSALKSREIEEWRRKPWRGGGAGSGAERLPPAGEVQRLEEEEETIVEKRKEKRGTQRAKDGPTDEPRRTQRRRDRQKVVRPPFVQVHIAPILTRSPPSSSSRFFFRLAARASLFSSNDNDDDDDDDDARM